MHIYTVCILIPLAHTLKVKYVIKVEVCSLCRYVIYHLHDYYKTSFESIYLLKQICNYESQHFILI